MKAWIQELSKEEATAECQILGIDPEGTLESLRRRLRSYVDAHPAEFATGRPIHSAAERIAVPTTATEIGPATASATAPRAEYATAAPRHDTLRIPMPLTPHNMYAEALDCVVPTPRDDSDLRPPKVANQMRKWGLHFEGKDPWAFLERVEELRDEYEYSDKQLLRGLPELLKGDALLWYRNTRDSWGTWEDFLEDFRATYFPPRYHMQLRNEIRDRVHKTGETYLKYATSVLSLMRRAGGYSEEEKVEQLYHNLHPEYQWRIRRRDIRTTRDLLTEATECEMIQKRMRADAIAKGTTREPTVAAAAYSRTECCWRCKQRGHTRFECKRPAKRFCSQCGKDGVLTKECHPPPGNAEGTGAPPAAPRDPPS